VTGSGGVGKTRTLLEVAATLLDGWRDGVWFIELAPLTSGKYIPRTVAHALGLSFATRGNALDHLARALQPKQALLVLDNCEHLLEAAAHVASTLLRHCPQVKLLASSRQRLGIAGEETYPLPSLDTTTNDAAAITLFAERARAANKRFALTEDNAPSVTEICRRLDGIPLAIELAASRVNVLAPRQLLERLDARFALLTGGSRDALPRQQTLQATIDWSHDLLDAPRRALFRRLGIFVNGFTLEGAAAVGGSGLEGSDVFEVLASLLDRSLVHAVPDGERLRYRLLESTRVYASERLAEAGERAAVAACHLRYLRDRFAQVMAEVHQSARVSDLTETLATELEDVRAALAGALDRSDVIAGGELNVHLGRGMSFIGLAGEERTWCEKFIPAIPGDRPDIAARLRLKLSSNLLENGQSARAMELAEQAVAFARESGDPETLGWALKEYSGAAIELGRLDDAETALAEAERIPRISTFLRLRLLRLRALLTEARGEHEAALRMFGDVVNEARLRGDSVVEQRTLRHVVLGEHQRGRTHEAIAIARDVLATHGSGLDTEERARWLRYLAMFLAAAGDHLPEAAAAAREATVVFAMQGPEGPAVTAAIEVQALIYALLGDVDRAATLAGYAEAAYRREPFQRESAGAGAHERLVALLRERLAPAGLERLSAHGARLTPEAAVAVALEEPARHAGG
jgi:predicted ATPase